MNTRKLGTVVVLQSYRTRDVAPWIELCLASVRRWAASRGYDYVFVGDELFDKVPPWYLEKTAGRLPVATDYARLVLLHEALEQGGAERAIWLDADVLVFDPALALDFDDSCAFGQELWVQDEGGVLRARRNVHNAVCAFTRGCAVLPFLQRTVLSIIRRADPARIAPQMVGPKLLGALHSLADFALLPQLGAFSPLVLRDLAAGGGPALDLLRARSAVPPQAANLCASLSDADVAGRALVRLMEKGAW